MVAKIISGVAATILSYILNREWTFNNRGGRERHHEALLFFVISGIGVVLAAAPLWVANNVFNLREAPAGLELAILDFFLACHHRQLPANGLPVLGVAPFRLPRGGPGRRRGWFHRRQPHFGRTHR